MSLSQFSEKQKLAREVVELYYYYYEARERLAGLPVVSNNLPRPPIDWFHIVMEVARLNQVT
jgi:hypothetical protein